ncbi:MAG: nucleotidyltransferase family protein [Anaerolineae bacterium]|nr:nucleotidyltransferase family protein [Anaerolineae bacterium]
MDNTLAALSSLVIGKLSPLDEWIEEDWIRIVETALSNGMGPMLLWSLAQAGLRAESWALPLKRESRWIGIENIRLEMAFEQVKSAFEIADIPALWVKGIVLSATVYPEPTLRPMSDLDVLVQPDHRDRALKLLKTLGYLPGDWKSLFEVSDPITSEFAYHQQLHHQNLGVILELHERFPLTILKPENMAWFWTQKQSLNNSSAMTLMPEAHLLYLCAHATLQHGENEFRLLRYLDLHLLITQTELQWSIVVEQAITFGWTYSVERALNVTKKYFATQIPNWVFAQLESRRPASEDVLFAERLGTKGADWGKVRRQLAMLPLEKRFRYLARIAFPPFAFMRQHYGNRFGRFTVLAYFYRWYNQGIKVSSWLISKRERSNEHSKLP